MKKNDLSVIFLMWVPYGIDYLVSFIESYQKYDSGTDHDLIILYNGYGTLEKLKPYEDYLQKNNVAHSYLTLETGQDITAYRWAAQQTDSEYLLFFNTYSQILHSDWGKNYLHAIKGDRVGCVGATGSWQSWASVGLQKAKLALSSDAVIKDRLPYFDSKQVSLGSLNLKIHPRLVLLGSMVKSMKVYNNFPKFPNPHLRTNAFIIRKDTWLSLKFPDLKNKGEAHWFESGNESFTRQILKSGKKVLVMNKYGAVFEPEKWNVSKTLWSSRQEDLLVSDNFTRQYVIDPQSESRPFENFLWGVKK